MLAVAVFADVCRQGMRCVSPRAHMPPWFSAQEQELQFSLWSPPLSAISPASRHCMPVSSSRQRTIGVWVPWHGFSAGMCFYLACGLATDCVCSRQRSQDPIADVMSCHPIPTVRKSTSSIAPSLSNSSPCRLKNSYGLDQNRHRPSRLCLSRRCERKIQAQG